MKTALLILLLLPLVGLSQKNTLNDKQLNDVISEIKRTDILIGLWDQYLSDCNQLAADTIKQDGIVNVKYKPVIVNGEINHYILSPVDTVWNNVNCKTYKIGNNDFITSDSLGNTWPRYSLLNLTSAISYTPTEQVNNKINITRNKICHIKKHKASWDDFWNRWLVEKKIIELN